jgi:hypothetical protein
MKNMDEKDSLNPTSGGVLYWFVACAIQGAMRLMVNADMIQGIDRTGIGASAFRPLC